MGETFGQLGIDCASNGTLLPETVHYIQIRLVQLARGLRDTGARAPSWCFLFA